MKTIKKIQGKIISFLLKEKHPTYFNSKIMRITLFSLLSLMILFFDSNKMFSQGGVDTCSYPSTCLTDIINISTGYNQNTMTYQTPTSNESNWTLVSGPLTANLSVNPPSYVIPPYPVWNSFASAQWVSPFANPAYIINNCRQPFSAADAFLFTKCFCTCGPTTIHIKFNMLVDDGAVVLLDGQQIGSALNGYQFLTANQLIVDTNITVSNGSHCLEVRLYNCGAVAMGFAIEGTVSGPNLVKPNCCKGFASICGTKINDLNCDGIINTATDPGLGGWTIQLKDSLGNIITAVTDALGSYCFTNLIPGTYVISEVNQSGWTQTYPIQPGTHTITVSAGDVGTANFGNCVSVIDPCSNFYVDYNATITNCKVIFTALIPAMQPGYQVVSSVWTFGDGYSSTQLNPTHYYTATGVYNVCLSVTIFNGTVCCTKQFCQQITIINKCEGGCDFNAKIKIVKKNCNTFDFSANVIAAGSPVTSIFWDFGDATTGNGSPITHQYAANGTYQVTMTLFSTTGNQCCFKKIKRNVVVNCVQSGSPKSNEGDGIEIIENIELNDKINSELEQNIPNPFGDATVINYNIANGFKNAQITFTNVIGKTIKIFNITSKGAGQLNISATDLSAGIYLYSLIIDGKIIDSKRIIKN